jgi:RNA polymerase sigma factor (sigma-70 family)
MTGAGPVFRQHFTSDKPAHYTGLLAEKVDQTGLVRVIEEWSTTNATIERAMPADPLNKPIPELRQTLLRGEGASFTDRKLLERFVNHHDQAALELLIRRYAPMVWGVCRRILANHHDAEDAFQATFLVLVRKAESIRPKEMVGNWLYGVARQTVFKARATTAKRRAREKQVTEMPEPAVTEQQDLWDDVQPLLDQELSRLPAKYRAVVVLCDLGAKTRTEVAQQLGVPEGTVASRLVRARTILAKRLARHGMPVAGGTLAVVLSQQPAPASVPISVVSSTIKAASLLAAGNAAAGAISGEVTALTKGVLHTMFVTKMKTIAAIVLALATVVGGAGVFAYQSLATEADKKDKAKPDNEAIQGKWEVDSLVSDKGASEEEAQQLKSATWVFEKEKLVWKRVGDKNFEATYKLDPTKTPKSIDLTMPFGEPKRHIQGIYKLEGDELTIWIPLGQEKPRPTEFEAEKGSKRTLIVLKRMK